MMNKFSMIGITALLALSFPFTSAHAIKKCKDAEGKWHYGDIAVAACKQSKVTTLNKRGFVKAEQEAPKTDAEIEAEREANELAAAEAKRLREEDEERTRILSVYETEADIDRQRDNQVNSVESNIAVHKAYLKSMKAKIVRLQEKAEPLKGKRKERIVAQITDAKTRIKESGVELKALEKQKAQIVKRFAKEKQTYRELKGQS